MKKTFAVLFLISFLAVLAVPLVTSAQVADCCKIRRGFTFEATTTVVNTCWGAKGATSTPCGCTSLIEDDRWGMVCILNTIYRVGDLAFAILVAITILLILLAAYTFLTAGGDPVKVNKARDYILYALVGLIVAFLARAIPSLVALIV